MNKTANRLTEMEFDEVSLVTRPANQLSKVMLFKSDTESEEEMSEVAVDETEIEVTDVEETEVSKKSKKNVPAMEEEETQDEENAETPEEAQAETEAGTEKPVKKKKVAKDDEEILVPAEVMEYISALESANEELLGAISKMEEEMAEAEEAEEQEILKSADPRLVEIVKAAEERAFAAEAIAKAERDFRLEREFVSKAQEMSHLPVSAEDFGLVLKSASDVLPTETFDALMQVLSAANAQLEKGGIFGEVGKSTVDADDAPMSAIEKAAARLQSENPTLTKEQAIAKAVSADASLYTQYIREGR